MKPRILTLAVMGLFLVSTGVQAEDWQVVWKDSTQTIRLDRDSVRVNGQTVEYWYSDEVDAIVDFMEHHYHVVSDCTANQIRHLEVYDPVSGETRPVQDQGWRELPYDPQDAVTVMHYEMCRDYATSVGSS
jgi:hypothetical protein